MNIKKVGLDLTKPKIKKFNEYISVNFIISEKIDIEEIIKRPIGLDLVSNESGYKIDITKYLS